MNKNAILAFSAICVSIGSAVAIADVGKPKRIDYEHNGGNPKGMIQFKPLAQGKPDTEYRCRPLRPKGYEVPISEFPWIPITDWVDVWYPLSKPFKPNTDAQYWEVEFRTKDGTAPPEKYLIDLAEKPFGNVSKKIKATVEIEYGMPESGKGSRGKQAKKR